MLAAVFAAVMLQQAAGQAVVWSETPPPVVDPVSSAVPAIPDWARADPYAYERSECSPMIRKAEESQEACQARVRAVLAANLGDALPAGLRPAGAPDSCQRTGDRYAMQCGAPSRPDQPSVALAERSCITRPVVTGQGAVSYEEDCGASRGSDDQQDGLRITLGGKD
jgi:hypothetical protein